MKRHDIRQTIVFSADKLCWPTDLWRSAFWAVPNSTLPGDVFGPETDPIWGDDITLNRPRWLNSGTIMGPVKDMRDMFNQTDYYTNNWLNQNFTFKNSDQLYFADVFGDQEYARHRTSKGKPLPTEPEYDSMNRTIPVYEPGQRTEFYIGLDYESEIFQNLAGWYEEFLIWRTYDDGRRPMFPGRTEAANVQESWDIPLETDIMASPGPFSAITPRLPSELHKEAQFQNSTAVDCPTDLAWKNTPSSQTRSPRPKFPPSISPATRCFAIYSGQRCGTPSVARSFSKHQPGNDPDNA